MLEIPDCKQRRIYRWGSSWGIQCGEKWTCETRTHISDSEDMLIELIHSQTCDILPLEMDDIWEEEYITLGGLEYNGLVSLRGTAAAILDIAKQHQLPTPPLPPLSLNNTPSIPVPTISASQLSHKPIRVDHTHRNNRNNRKCLIRD